MGSHTRSSGRPRAWPGLSGPRASTVRTCKGALQPLAAAGQVAAGAEEAAQGGGHHGHKQDQG